MPSFGCRQLINLVHEELLSTFPQQCSLLLIQRVQVALDFAVVFRFRTVACSRSTRFTRSASSSSGSIGVAWLILQLGSFRRGEVTTLGDVPSDCSTCAANFFSCGDAVAPSSTTVSTAHSQYCLSWAHTLVRLPSMTSEVQGCLSLWSAVQVSRWTLFQVYHCFRLQITKDRKTRLEVDHCSRRGQSFRFLGMPMEMCHVFSWLHFHSDLGQRFFTLGVTELVHGSIGGTTDIQPGSLPTSYCALSRIASITSTLPTAPDSRSQTLSRCTSHLIGTQIPRSEVRCMYHVTSMLLILCARASRISDTVSLIGLLKSHSSWTRR